MYPKKSILLFIITVIVLASVVLEGCKKEPEKSPPKSPGTQETQGKEKEPEELKEITKNIESLIKETQKKQEMAKKPPEEEGKQKPQGSKQDAGGGSQEGGQQQGQQEQQQEDPLKNWDKEEKSVTDIHKKWNTLEIEAVKIGVDDTLRNEFEDNLDSLTDAIMAKDITNTLKTANELYGSAVKIADFYQTNNPPETDMMKYYTQKALLFIEEENWEEAAGNVNSLKKQWEKVKIMMGDRGATLMAQMDYGIMDFMKSIEKQNKEVGKIKGEIVIGNIEKVAKEVEKAQKK